MHHHNASNALPLLLLLQDNKDKLELLYLPLLLYQ